MTDLVSDSIVVLLCAGSAFGLISLMACVAAHRWLRRAGRGR